MAMASNHNLGGSTIKMGVKSHEVWDKITILWLKERDENI